MTEGNNRISRPIQPIAMSKACLSSGPCGHRLDRVCNAFAYGQLLGSIMVVVVAIYRFIFPSEYIHNLDKQSPILQRVLLNELDEVALEMLVAGLSSLVASILLILGLKKMSTSLIYPWIILTSMETASFVFIVAFRLIRPRSYYSIHGGKLAVAIICHGFILYMIVAVYSYYHLLKESKKRPRLSFHLESGYPSTEMLSLSGGSDKGSVLSIESVGAKSKPTEQPLE
eukprot:maker-scaffold954_size76946-snap-gene-0.22 protein:Tk12146 transcript:maker-scaffold954_size76946-snap-gene-0.22-mRNA-1 annotation:"PREDICTED: uncharacterized protein LOC103512918"